MDLKVPFLSCLRLSAYPSWAIAPGLAAPTSHDRRLEPGAQSTRQPSRDHVGHSTEQPKRPTGCTGGPPRTPVDKGKPRGTPHDIAGQRLCSQASSTYAIFQTRALGDWGRRALAAAKLGRVIENTPLSE